MKVAAFSFDKKFGDFRKTWLDYYETHCDSVEVINDDVPDGKDVYEKFNNVSPVLQKRMTDLFTKNDIVIYTDIDEYLIPDPFKYRGLKDYIAHFAKKNDLYARATGMNVVQVLGEPKINFNEILLDQRKYWSKDPFYNKVNICKKPTRFIDGMVNPEEGKPEADPDLILCHFKYIDYDEEMRRGKQRRGYGDKFNIVDSFWNVARTAEIIPQKFKTII